MRARELSARELAEHYLERIALVQPALNAVAAIDGERVREEADAADDRRHRGHDTPLLGLPVTVKDNLDVAGYPTAAGSAGAFPPAASDASVVARLRTAGAVVLAKTNVPECSSSYETDNIAFGRTNHPLDPSRTAGGSSGGEAALLAADASPVGVGTDGGGSIRVPAHYCGVLGLRPTTGRTPETGQRPPTRATGMMDLSCVGPLARTVDDLALVLAIIAGPDGTDPYAIPVPLGDLGVREGAAPLRVGFYDHDPLVPATTEGTRAAVRAAAETLSRDGWPVEEIEPPRAPEATDLFFAAVGADAGAHLRAHFGPGTVEHHPVFAALLERLERHPPSAAEYFETQRRIFDLRARVRALAARYDLLLSPVVAGPAPRHGQSPAGRPEDGLLDYAAFHYVHVVALAGLPAASVPMASEDGLPIGVQVVAAPFREDLVLAGARRLERSAGGFQLTRRLAAATSR